MRKIIDAERAMQWGLGKDWVGTVIDDETQEVLAYVDHPDLKWPDILKRPAEMIAYEALGEDRENDPDYWAYGVDKDAVVMLFDFLYGGKGYMYAPVRIPDNVDDLIVDVPEDTEFTTAD